MDAKFDLIDGAKGSKENDILKTLQEIKGSLSRMDGKLDEVVMRISSLERMVKSYSKHQVRSLLPKF